MNAEISTLVSDFTQRLSATRRGARLARRLALHQLDAWGIPYGSDVSDAVAHVVAELAANAVTHGHVPGRDFQLRLQLSPHTVRVEVTDTRTERQPPTPGQVAPPSADSECGRGLLLVQGLSHAWGITERVIGKTIWAEVPLPAAHLTGSSDLPAQGETEAHPSRHLSRP
ncbi:ATP-binding protein [Streptomyces sp. SID12488]|uniref:ATP-binding protein n=1 Tax=Streptomyces sp. SID12488 TaxID=2706040 RepID=UPI0013DA1965|nr:ATP-binding protein [Streptomyces sp. SID12488]NEA62025.1 ATP-binding protein [Streptomyces sp. SID12488]